MSISARKLIVLPGWGFSGLSYSVSLAPLQGIGYELVFPDIRFKKVKNPEASLDIFLSELNTYLKQLSEPYTLMGVSLGGLITFRCVSRYRPPGIEQLILVDAAGTQDGLQLHTLFGSVGSLWIRTLLRHKAIRPTFYATIDFLGNLFIRPAHLIRSLRVALRCRISDDEMISDIPTLIVWGEQDRVLPIKNAQRYRSHIPNGKMRTVAGDHNWIQYTANQLIPIIDDHSDR